MTTNGGGALESNNNLRKEIPTSHDLVGSEVKVCPYIRLLGDKDTAAGYPSEINHCLRVKPSASPKNECQREYCLNEKHLECMIFQSEKCDKETREEIFGRQKIPRKPFFLISIILLVVLLGLLMFFPGWVGQKGMLFGIRQSVTKQTASFVEPVGLTETQKGVFTQATQTPTKTATPNPPTVTPSPIPPRLLETPFGLEQRFVIHRVVEGDNLIYLSETYTTSVEAILAANYPLAQPILDNSILVIPYRNSNPEFIVPLTAIEIKQENLTLREFANKLSLDEQVISKLNALPPEHVLRFGEWLLIPKPTKEP